MHHAKASALPFSPRLCLGVSLPLGQVLGTLQTTACSLSMCRDAGHEQAQVMAEGDTLPWHTCGVGRHGRALGRMHGSGRCPLPTTKGAQMTKMCVVHPRPGLTTPSITRQRDRHRGRTGVSTLSHGWERAGAPSCPGSRFAGGRIASPGLGWIQPAIGLWQALISAPAVNFPPQPSGATGSAGAGLLPSLPHEPGEPQQHRPQGDEGWGNVFRRNCRPSFIPSMYPAVRWVDGWPWSAQQRRAGSGFGAGKG